MKKYFTVYYVDKHTGEVVNADIVTARTASDAAIIAELSMNEEDLKHYSCCAGAAPFYFNK
jgi:hypothetical protein